VAKITAARKGVKAGERGAHNAQIMIDDGRELM
jgi:hypothetical protein